MPEESTSLKIGAAWRAFGGWSEAWTVRTSAARVNATNAKSEMTEVAERLVIELWRIVVLGSITIVM